MCVGPDRVSEGKATLADATVKRAMTSVRNPDMYSPLAAQVTLFLLNYGDEFENN